MASQQALYRKWRSQTFGEVIGQEHVVQTLRHAILEERVAHAYLFTGPRGVGKTSMARLLAKAVNCAAPLPERPCGVCESCQAISDGRAVDIIEMDAASHTSVEDAREIIERVQFRPTTGRKKVYVIDEVHMLSTAAFNALLKTLEEPPDHALFILATTESHKVPATILSRCQRFTFTRHTIAATTSHIQHIAVEEAVTLEPGVAEAIARAATGSMRDALGVLEQLISFSSGTITLEQVQQLLGMSSEAEIAALIEALLQANLSDALRAVNSVAEQGVDMRQFTRDLVERLRALLLLVATGNRTLPDASEDELVVLEGWAQQSNMGVLKHWVHIFSTLDYQLRTSPYGHLPLELAVVEALLEPEPATPPQQTRPTTSQAAAPATRPAPHPSPQPTKAAKPAKPPQPAEPAKPAEKPASTPQQPEPAPSASNSHPLTPGTPEEKPAQPARPDNAPPSLLEKVKALWPAVVQDVRPKNATVQALLRDVQPVSVEEQTVVLLAKSEFHKQSIESRRNRLVVEEVLSKHMGKPFAVRCIIDEQQEAKTDTRSQIQAICTDPVVRAAMNIFSADVIDVEENERDKETDSEEY
jgi:DNA polymerase-3 subunit gamma/tau